MFKKSITILLVLLLSISLITVLGNSNVIPGSNKTKKMDQKELEEELRKQIEVANLSTNDLNKILDVCQGFIEVVYNLKSSNYDAEGFKNALTQYGDEDVSKDKEFIANTTLKLLKDTNSDYEYLSNKFVEVRKRSDNEFLFVFMIEYKKNNSNAIKGEACLELYFDKKEAKVRKFSYL